MRICVCRVCGQTLISLWVLLLFVSPSKAQIAATTTKLCVAAAVSADRATARTDHHCGPDSQFRRRLENGEVRLGHVGESPVSSLAECRGKEEGPLGRRGRSPGTSPDKGFEP
jgi:hypothetical protein